MRFYYFLVALFLFSVLLTGCSVSNVFDSSPVQSKYPHISLPTDEGGNVITDGMVDTRLSSLDDYPLRIIGNPSEEVVFLYSVPGGDRLVAVKPGGEYWTYALWNTDKCIKDPRKMSSGNYSFLVPGSGVYEVNSLGDVVGFVRLENEAILQVEILKGDKLFVVTETRIYEYDLEDGIETWGWSPGAGRVVDAVRLNDSEFLICINGPDVIVRINRDKSVLWTYGTFLLKGPFTADRSGKLFTYICDDYGRVLQVMDNHNISWSYGNLGVGGRNYCRILREGTVLITDNINGRILEVDKGSNDVRFEIRELVTVHALFYARGRDE